MKLFTLQAEGTEPKGLLVLLLDSGNVQLGSRIMTVSEFKSLEKDGDGRRLGEYTIDEADFTKAKKHVTEILKSRE